MVWFKCKGCAVEPVCEVVIRCKGTTVLTPTVCLYDLSFAEWEKKKKKRIKKAIKRGKIK